jgi:hypothetical protein
LSIIKLELDRNALLSDIFAGVELRVRSNHAGLLINKYNTNIGKYLITAQTSAWEKRLRKKKESRIRKKKRNI